MKLSGNEILPTLWQRLAATTQLKFEAQSAHHDGWNGSGAGNVCVERVTPSTLLYHEHGRWRTARGAELNFSNVYRWTLLEQRIRLEHLRFGADAAVFLFEIEASGPAAFRSVEPHVCRADLYSASLKIEAASLRVEWVVTGPSKQERIDYVYR